MDRRGYTLVELIIAIAILLIVSWPLLSMVVEGSRNNQRTRHIEEATQIAQRLMEERIHSPNLSIVTDEDIVFTTGPYQGYTARVNVRPALAPDLATMRREAGQAETVAPTMPSVPLLGFITNTGRQQSASLPVNTIATASGLELSGLVPPSSGSDAWPIPTDIEDRVFEIGRINTRGNTTGNVSADGMDILIRLSNGNVTIDVAGMTVPAGEFVTNIICIGTEINAAGTSGRINIRFGNAISSPVVPIEVDNISEGVRIGFVIEGNTTRQLRLLNRPHFRVSANLIRGVNTEAPAADGTLPHFDNRLDALQFRYHNPATDGLISREGNSSTWTNPAFASANFILDRGFYMQNGAWSTGNDDHTTLYDVEVRVFRTEDGVTGNALVELQSLARSIPR